MYMYILRKQMAENIIIISLKADWNNSFIITNIMTVCKPTVIPISSQLYVVIYLSI